MKTAFYYLVMGAAVILPGAFIFLFVALAKKVYLQRRVQGQLFPWKTHKAIS